MSYRIFLSGPMTNDDYTNFHKAEEYALSLSKYKDQEISDDFRLEVLNPSLGNGSENYSHQRSTWFRAALNSLSYADEVWFLPGWRNARGSIVEFTVALSLRLPLYEWNLNFENVLLDLNHEFEEESFSETIIELLEEQNKSYRSNNSFI